MKGWKMAAVLLAAALAALLGWRVWQKAAAGPGRDRPAGLRAVPVAVEAARRERIRDVAEFSGTLTPRAEYTVAPKIPGRLERLYVQIGDAVTNGALLAELDSEEYAQQAAQARAELEVSRAAAAETRSAMETAAREYRRVKELRAQQIASESEYDEAESRARAAEAKHLVVEAQIKQRDAALKAAEIRLDYTRIRASWTDGDGRRLVAERFVHEGAMLKANDAIVAVVDVGTVLAVVHVIERDYPDIRVGQVAEVLTDAYPDRTFTGRVVRLAPVLREESRQARVEIELPNPEARLAPGMFVRARICFAEREAAAVVSASALVRRNGTQGLFVADPGALTVRFVPVRLGIVNGDVAEVVDPPVTGLVVTLGQHLLQDGATVALSGPAAPAGAAPPPAPSGRRR
jgi:RND family efflux transporter MFP subunit